MDTETTESTTEPTSTPPVFSGRLDGVPIPQKFLDHIGKGRPKGSPNKLTQERREFIDLVVGKQGTEERTAFAAALRTQFLNGTINPQIAQTILYWWLGKPKEKIEVELGLAQVTRVILKETQHPDVDVPASHASHSPST